MTPNNTSREQIITLIEQQYIQNKDIDLALKKTEVSPLPHAWRTFINMLMLWLGALSLVFSILFFVAYNWTEIGRFSQFSMVEIAIILAIVTYYKVETDNIVSSISLVTATLLLGVLLALFGQTYQTGADTWQLFFYWAILMLPWAIIGRFSVIWIVWVSLLNLSIILYYQVFQSIWWTLFDSQSMLYWMLFAFNVTVHIVWELILRYQRSYISEHWSIRIIALASGIPITWLVLIDIVETYGSSLFPTFIWILYLCMIYIMYRKIKPDLFVLAGACLSVNVVIITFLSMHILEGFDAGGFFILALCVIGLGTASAFWLKNIHKELNV